MRFWFQLHDLGKHHQQQPHKHNPPHKNAPNLNNTPQKRGLFARVMYFKAVLFLCMCKPGILSYT